MFIHLIVHCVFEGICIYICIDYFQVEEDNGKIKFKSNFFGCVSVDVFIPPNQIDFDDIFTNFASKSRESWAVILVVGLLLMLYVICLLIACRYDRRERRMVIYITGAPIGFNTSRKYF